jgi:hypothetical protein
MAILFVSVVEIGLIYGATQTLGYASREAARVAAAFANGTGDCTLDPGGGNPDPDPAIQVPPVDAVAVGAAQRVIQSPDSGVKLGKVLQVRIFKADSAGRQIGNFLNLWSPPGPGPDIDPGSGEQPIAFQRDQHDWPACSRINGGVGGPDSVGVTVVYDYDFVTPMGAFLDALTGGSLDLTLRETTVMALNPTIN